MKRIPVFLIALSLFLPAHSAPINEGIIGNFELKAGKPGNSVEIRLECETETICTLITTSQWKTNPPEQTKETLDKIHTVNEKTLDIAIAALAYAVNQQYNTIRHEEDAESIRRLKPVLSTNPSIDKCWDLNYPTPGYMLACTFSNAPDNNPPVYLFGALLANCGEAFCRYVINPMERIKSASHGNN